MEFHEIEEKLQQSLSPQRWIHSQGVSMVAYHLAEKYGGNKEKAKIAGLLHDCAKELSLTMMQKVVEKIQEDIPPAVMESRALLHGPAGSVWAEKEYGITDSEIKEAIYFHTTGRPDMSLLEKIVFLADYIEPSRKFPGVDTIRQATEQSLDAGVLAAYDSTIHHLLDNQEYIYEMTFLGRNHLVLKQEHNEKNKTKTKNSL